MPDAPDRVATALAHLPDTPGVDPHILATHPTGDFRDWEAIRAWARAIAADLDRA